VTYGTRFPEQGAVTFAGLPPLALREFQDERGRSWIVWEVLPTALQQKRARERSREKQAADAPKRPVSKHLETGWLAFECGNERRRLAPPPPEWSDSTDQQLRELLAQAHRVARTRRLIE
jgi:hypothetical protein